MKATHAFYREPLAEALRAHTGRMSGGVAVDDLAESTGISPRRLYAMRDGDAEVSIDELGVLIRALPADFGARVLAPFGVSSVSKGGQDSGCPFQLNAHLARQIASLTEKLADDGRVDHREARQLVPELRHLREAIDGFVAAYDPDHNDNVTPFAGGQ